MIIVSSYNTSILVEATYLDIVCTVNISDAVNTGICEADFNVTGVNGTDDPVTATYDAQSREQDVIVELEMTCNMTECTVT